MRRVWAALALLGCFMQALVLPWHVSSRLPVTFSASALAGDLVVICHTDGTTSTTSALPGPEQPADPSAECLVCKGMLGFQLVVLAAAQAGLLAPDTRPVFFRPAHIDGVSTVAVAPRSRGPPLSI